MICNIRSSKNLLDCTRYHENDATEAMLEICRVIIKRGVFSAFRCLWCSISDRHSPPLPALDRLTDASRACRARWSS